jgi:leucyl aminopeptidase
MENTEKNFDDVIAKAITDPEGTMQSLDNAKNTLQQLSDKVNQVKATAGVQDTNSGMQTEDDSASQWSFEDTIDELTSTLENVMLVRHLVNYPSTDLNPESYSKMITQAFGETILG